MADELQKAATEYPVVTLIGPRQSGKTTLVKQLFPHKPYINLEAPDIRQFAEYDPRGLLAQYPEGVIFDEVQRAPALLSYIQESVDEKPAKGKYILTGSHQMALHEAITQSLAGRTAILKLLPLSMQELSGHCESFTVDDWLYQGFYPRIYQDKLNPTKAYRNYFETYVERDVRQLINVKDINLFEKFMRLCAGRIGQLLDYTNLANEVGVSAHTIKQWLSVLQASFIIVQLQPYYENFNKRVIKSSKLYFVDVGLASYLLGIENPQQLTRDPLRGNLFENLVMMEMIKYRYNLGLDPQLYFYRDNHQHEVDLIYKQGNQLIPIEIKSSATFHASFIKGAEYFMKLAGERSPHGYVIYTGEQENTSANVRVLNYQHVIEII